MKTIKFLAVSFVIASLAITAFADSTLVDSSIKDSVVLIQDTIVESVQTAPVETLSSESGLSLYAVLSFLIGLYELIVRLFPTAKNYSFISLAYNLINFIIPNFKKNGGKH